MKLVDTKIKGAFIVSNSLSEDERGGFCKFFNADNFRSNDLEFKYEEMYYSISHKNVIRGMHFQEPPFDHSKIIHCISGEVLDVFLDLRRNSPSYLKFDSCLLKKNDGKIIYLPKGVAHGFLSLKHESIVLYSVSSVYNQSFDNGILWNSFGYRWPCKKPILSGRDESFKPLELFKSPFL